MSEEDDRKELVDKLKALSLMKFGTDDAWPKLFSAYDADGDDHLTASEVSALFSDADIGNFVTRPVWIERVMSGMDADGVIDSISREELEEAIKRFAPPASLEAKPLTRAEARVIGRMLATRPDSITLDETFSEADIALIEEMTAQEHDKAFGKATTTTPPIPPRDAPPSKIPQTAEPSPSVAQQIVIGVLVGVITLRLLARLR